MSQNCPYCGGGIEPCGSMKNEEKRCTSGGRSWWCFGSKKNESPEDFLCESVPAGKYEKRRSTVAYGHKLSNMSGIKKKMQGIKQNNQTTPPAKTALKLLFVFNTVDMSCYALKRAAHKLGFEINQCNTTKSAYEDIQTTYYDLIVIDSRSTKNIDHELLCRSIRSCKSTQHTPVMAFVTKGFFEKEEYGVLNLLECGFNRCLVESNNVSTYVNELVQIQLSDMKLITHRSTNHALYIALDKCNNLVFITDENLKCQYVNVTIERCLKMSQDEAVGKNLEVIVQDKAQFSSISSLLLRNKEWTGQLLLKGKTDESVAVNCKAHGVASNGILPNHFVVVMDVISPTEISNRDIMSHEPRRSDFRKSSLNKRLSFPLETPAMRVMNLLNEAREKIGDNVELMEITNKIEEMVKHSELNLSGFKGNLKLLPSEPVVSDLITALLNNQPQKLSTTMSRRSSNESSIFRTSKILRRQNNQLDELLDTSLTWNFEIFQLEEMTKNRPLQHLGMYYCQQFDIASSLNCDEATLKNWFIIIESHYHNEICYHNSTHATDVMQAMAGFLCKDRIRDVMQPLDEAICLLAAAAHDVDHPGKSSAFLANSNNPLAILYNDYTILENHHAACMFKLTLGDDRVNIFKNLSNESYKLVRNNIIDMILATEMTKHFDHLSRFVNVFCERSQEDYSIDDVIPDNLALLKRMLIKCADLSNPTRPFRIYMEWARRIAEEYFQQTDEEKNQGLPVVMPLFDRDTCSLPKSQIGFVDYIVNDMFAAWNDFVNIPEAISQLRENYMQWKELDEQNHKTLADIKLLQRSGKFPSVPLTKMSLTESKKRSILSMNDSDSIVEIPLK